jgi:hypothetical protein
VWDLAGKIESLADNASLSRLCMDKVTMGLEIENVRKRFKKKYGRRTRNRRGLLSSG